MSSRAKTKQRKAAQAVERRLVRELNPILQPFVEQMRANQNDDAKLEAVVEEMAIVGARETDRILDAIAAEGDPGTADVVERVRARMIDTKGSPIPDLFVGDIFAAEMREGLSKLIALNAAADGRDVGELGDIEVDR